ncbi:DUF4365 domain-containing protein [Actinacidiphila oryziradicis]|uniref:DUF4365 domain-containing protein n=1 Tax=Actinacidiphila oryziradicis TaxID=2571141 RepID=A0A4U0RXZ9_9ACTN|nr:DUF4365 domain-containing protein [Actinacidiphila oryziradicis]TJZ99710.1 DUF4365 domain-containing protein [Actinacidiphila oryziradicis]
MSGHVSRHAGIPPEAHKERASYYTLGLIANAAGCYLSDPHLDFDCIDTTVVASGARFRRWRFDVQLKCSSSDNTVRRLVSGDYSMSLPAGQYDLLRLPGSPVPMRFVVLILPTGVQIPPFDPEGDSMRLDGIMLWSDPGEWPALPPGQESGRVILRREDEFTAEYIRNEMKMLSDGGAR